MGQSFYQPVLFAFLSVSWLTAQEPKETDNFPPPETPVTIQASRAMGRITIDGRLQEADWENTVPLTDFFRVEPLQGRAIKNPTTVRVLYDDRNLYFGMFASDSLGRKGVRMQDLRRDFDNDENDSFGIQIDAQNTKQYAVSFQTTPYGNQLDLQNFNDTNTDTDWNESKKDQSLLSNVLESIRQENEMNIVEIQTVRPKQIALQDSVESNIHNSKAGILQILSNAGGFKTPTIKNASFRTVPQVKIELIDYEILRILSDIEEEEKVLERKISYGTSFLYQNLNATDKEEKTIFAILLSDIPDSENQLQTYFEELRSTY